MLNPRFIAETAFSHEGDVNYLLALVEEIIGGGSDFVKFQVLLKSEYEKSHPMSTKCYDLMLTKSDWLSVFKKVKDAGKKILALPVDIEALKWIMADSLVDAVEVHSVNLFRKDFYENISEMHSGFEVILSVSGYELSEIDFILKKYRDIEGLNFSLMFGFQAFPTEPKKLSLGRIAELKERFQVEVGYADHTSWDADSSGLCAAAIALGASTIEKHVVLDAGKERIDYNSAIDTIALNDLITKSRIVSDALGNRKVYLLNESEVDYGKRRLKLLCNSPLLVGEEVKPPKAEYCWSTSDSSVSVINGFEQFGKPSIKNFSKGEIIA